MRRRDAAFGTTLALLGPLLSACELTVSLKGLTGGTVQPADASFDSAVPPHGDGGADAGRDADASGGDSSVGSDGAVGANDSGQAGGDAGFCAAQSPTVTFCDDFDHGSLGVMWDNTIVDNGSIADDSAESVSAPNSALFSIAAVSTTTLVDVELNKAFPALAGERMTATLEFDILFDEVDEEATPASTIMAAIDLVDPQENLYEVQVVVQYHPDGGVLPTLAEMAIDSSGNTTNYLDKSTGVSIPLGKWTHVAFVYRLPYPDAGSASTAAASNAFDLYVADADIASLQVEDTVVNGMPRIVMGTGYVSAPSTPWKFHLDNVIFNAVALP